MKQLAHTGLSVGTVCLGADRAGTAISREDFFAILDRFVDHGGCFVDTANVYGRWAPDGLNHSERTVGAWLKSRGKKLTVATKGGHYALSDRRDRINREDLTFDVDTSLSALGVDCIDLYYLHRDDPKLPVGEICEFLHSFVRAGKLRALGASNWSPARVQAFNDYAATHALTGFSAVSNQYALAKVDAAHNTNPDPTLWLCDDEELAFHSRTQIALIPYQSTARGYFSRRAAGTPVPPSLAAAYDCPENERTLTRLLSLSADTGRSVQTLSITELVRSADFPLIPVVGVSHLHQLQDVLEAMEMLGQ